MRRRPGVSKHVLRFRRIKTICLPLAAILGPGFSGIVAAPPATAAGPPAATAQVANALDGRAHVIFDDTRTGPPGGVRRGLPATAALRAKAGRSTAARPDPEVLGFAQSGEVTSGAWRGDLRFGLLSTIAYFGVNLNGDGSMVTSDAGYQGWWSSQATDLINTAHGNGDRVVLTVKAFDGTTIAALAANDGARQNAVGRIVQEVGGRGADGVNVDFEGLNPAVGPGFNTFVAELHGALHNAIPQRSYLTVDTYATAAQGGTMFDIAALAPNVDAFDVMAYDFYHSGSTHAGPVAPLNGYWYNDTAAMNDYLRMVPASQIILGIPYYGYKWSTADVGPNSVALGRGTADPYAGIVSDLACATQLTGHWDPVAAEPWASWYSPATNDPCGGDHGSWRELYYENPGSLGAKYDLVNNDHLRGIGIWALGYDSGRGELWDEIGAKFAVTHNDTPFVRQIYIDILGRAPDPGGQASWTDKLSHGWGRYGVARAMLASTEYRVDEVARDYQSLLRRAADPSGAQWALGYLESGADARGLRIDMLASAEYFGRAGGTDGGFVDALYRDVLHRAADPGGRAAWVGQLGRGMARARVAAAMVTSPEAATGSVAAWYQQFLRRSPDPSSQSWVMALGRGLSEPDVIANIIASDEYFNYAIGHPTGP